MKVSNEVCHRYLQWKLKNKEKLFNQLFGYVKKIDPKASDSKIISQLTLRVS